MKKAKLNPKQRIYDTAVVLFARYGFAAVGVRDIAEAAEVNISMISYYYGGKIGILKDIIETFFDTFIITISGDKLVSLTTDNVIHTIIHAMVSYFKDHTNEAIIVFTELHRDVPQITELKTQKILHLMGIMGFLPQRLGFDENDNIQKSIVGPALISLAFSNFLLGPLMKNVFKVKYDDAYYEIYKKQVTTLFLRGVFALSENVKKGKEKNE